MKTTRLLGILCALMILIGCAMSPFRYSLRMPSTSFPVMVRTDRYSGRVDYLSATDGKVVRTVQPASSIDLQYLVFCLGGMSGLAYLITRRQKKAAVTGEPQQ